MIDKYGRTVTITSSGGNDTYTFAGNSISFPTGTPQSNALDAINGMAPVGYVKPPVPLNQQYSAADYGQLLINQVTAYNTARALTDAQQMTFASSFSSLSILLLAGALQVVLDEIPTIPVDGVLVTAPLVASLTAQLTQYLSGN